METLFVMEISEKNFAVPISNVERVVPAVEISPLPNSPEKVQGIINYQGEIIPVLNFRKMLLLEDKETELSDLFVIVKSNKRKIIINCENIQGLINKKKDELSEIQSISPNTKYIYKISRENSEILYIYDIDSFINLEEEESIKESIKILNYDKNTKISSDQNQ